MIITATAPIRVCDCGGWTDTWFARHGRVFNIAVQPGAAVRVETFPTDPGRPPLVIHAVDFRQSYAPVRREGGFDRHPLLEAAIESMWTPGDWALDVTVSCAVPPGASTGTSAAVAVALLGALDRARGGTLTRHDIARAAHSVETDRLGQQSGIQDQLCSAMGGVNLIEMTSYPDATVQSLPVRGAFRTELERRLLVVFVGRGHQSSAIHERVIQRLTARGPNCDDLEALRRAATAAAAAVCAEDLAALGQAMVDNTEAQRRLHPSLVGPDAERIIGLARTHNAAGWKVNGAGGEGGSLTLLGPKPAPEVEALRAAIEREMSGARVIPVSLDMDGLRVTPPACPG